MNYSIDKRQKEFGSTTVVTKSFAVIMHGKGNVFTCTDALHWLELYVFYPQFGNCIRLVRTSCHSTIIQCDEFYLSVKYVDC